MKSAFELAKSGVFAFSLEKRESELRVWMEKYLLYLRDVRGIVAESLYRAGRMFHQFTRWLGETGISEEKALRRETLEAYVLYLKDYRKKDGKPLTTNTQTKRLLAIILLCRYLFRQNLILTNPAKNLLLPKLGERLPRTVFTAAEMVRILSVPNVATTPGLRDRAVLEIFYSTGIRKGELIHLQLSDIDFEHGVIHIRAGKGNKDRVAAVGENALMWLRRYLKEGRTRCAHYDDIENVFITQYGKPFARSWLGRRVVHIIERAHLGKTGGCHSFRHTCATLMLENGASIRYVQAQLGHSRAETTQLYTKVAILALKDMFRKFHPRYDADEANAAEFSSLLAEHLSHFPNNPQMHFYMLKLYRFCLGRKVYSPAEITPALLTDYETHTNSLGFTKVSTQAIFHATNGFLRFLQAKGYRIAAKKWYFKGSGAGVKKAAKVRRNRGGKDAITAARKFALSADVTSLIEKYVTHMRLNHLSRVTINHAAFHLKLFFEFIATLDVLSVTEVTLAHLEAWQRHLAEYKRKNGMPLETATRIRRAKHVSQFFDFLFSRNLILVNPAERMEFAKQPYRLPMSILTEEEITRILNYPEIFARSASMRHIAHRNRAMLELFAATGIRRMEMANLRLPDIDQNRMTLLVREGKGDKDRIVPVTPRALYWLRIYLTEYRPSVESNDVFLKPTGEPLGDAGIDDVIKFIFRKSNIAKRGRSHLFRHTLATELLEAGAELRHIQELLGHKSINSTDIYTHVSIPKLKEVHTATHPGESLTRKRQLAGEKRAAERAQVLAG